MGTILKSRYSMTKWQPPEWRFDFFGEGDGGIGKASGLRFALGCVGCQAAGGGWAGWMPGLYFLPLLPGSVVVMYIA